MADEVKSMQLVADVPPALPPGEGWGHAPTLEPPRSALERPLAAIRRYKWLFVSIIAIATLGGVVATRFVHPEYEVGATVWIASQTPPSHGVPFAIAA